MHFVSAHGQGFLLKLVGTDDFDKDHPLIFLTALCSFTLKNRERQSIMAAVMILLPIEEHGGKIPGKEAVQ